MSVMGLQKFVYLEFINFAKPLNTIDHIGEFVNPAPIRFINDSLKCEGDISPLSEKPSCQPSLPVRPQCIHLLIIYKRDYSIG